MNSVLFASITAKQIREAAIANNQKKIDSAIGAVAKFAHLLEHSNVVFLNSHLAEYPNIKARVVSAWNNGTGKAGA